MIRTLAKAAAAAALLTLTSCSSLATGAMPAGLGELLGNVTGLSTSIGEWKSSLGAALDNTAFGKLEGFVDQAGELGGKITGFQDMVSDAMADPLGAIGNKLGEMGALDVQALQNLVPEQQLAQVQGFAESAENLGTLTNDFLSTFGG